jgi:hypothetical protein
MTRRENIRRALTAPCHLNLQSFFYPPTATESKCSRPAWSRLNQVLDMLMNGEQFNAKTLSLRLKTVTKTIHRDIYYLRRRGFKIIFNVRTNSFQLNGGAA